MNKEIENSSRSSFVLKYKKKRIHELTPEYVRDTNKQTAKSELTKRAVCRNEINGTVLERKIDRPHQHYIGRQLIFLFVHSHRVSNTPRSVCTVLINVFLLFYVYKTTC